MTLFSPSDLVPRRQVPSHEPPRQRSIQTGPPRLAEAPSRYFERANDASWRRLVEAVRQASSTRLELLKGRHGSDRLPCPWARLVNCDSRCRCGGVGTMTIERLRKHYARLPAEITKIARPAPVRRSSP